MTMLDSVAGGLSSTGTCAFRDGLAWTRADRAAGWSGDKATVGRCRIPLRRDEYRPAE